MAFTTLTSSTVVVFDELGNRQTPVIAVGLVAASLHYEVDTALLREGEIKAQLTLQYPNADLDGGTATDVLVQSLFTLEPLQV